VGKKIDLYTFIFNDAAFIPFFLDYYGPIADRMTFIDSSSTDGSLDLLKDHRVYQTGLDWWDWDYLHWMRQNVWKESKYDLIMFPDLDEIFYHPELKTFLNETDFDIYHMQGFQMVSKTFPVKGESILNYKKGIPLPLHNKYMIFKPQANISFPDAHYITTNSNNVNEFAIKLLHYKFLGADHMAKRAKTIVSRVPPTSHCNNINGNILKVFPAFVKSREEYVQEIENYLQEAKDVI
jgi:hypothetical protein